MTGKTISTVGALSLGLLAAVAAQGFSSAALAQSGSSAGDFAARCATLVGGTVGGARIAKANFLASDAKLPPFNDKLGFSFCRVDATISPVAGSHIKIAVWLPSKWNGKFVGTGGGGFDGGYAASPFTLRAPVKLGYAAMATDAGHDAAPEPKWVLESREKLIDYGHRANHLGAVVGKALVAEFYGKSAKRAFFQGCSNGGRDALMLAQRYPADYDAIVAGAPANDFTGLMASFVRTETLVRKPGIDLSAAKMKLVHDAVVQKCDAIDGAADGLLERPQMCRFDPAVLQCRQGGSGGCLTAPEVDVVKAIHAGVTTANGRHVMSGLPLGSEYEWPAWLTGPKAGGSGLGLSFFGYMVYRDVGWNAAGFQLDREYDAARSRLGPTIDAVDPDLKPFLRRGGKLLMYHGWDDAAIPAGNSLRYFASMRRKSGRLAAKQTRLFMMPGVAHCSGGNGPGSADFLGELDRWTESGTAPERIIAKKPESVFRAAADLPTKTLRSRPLCAWPKSARYDGSGSIDEAGNFVCR